MNRRTPALPVSGVLLLALLTACGQGTGSRPDQASASLGPATPATTGTAATSPATVPATTPAALDVAGALIRSADQAIAAVVSQHPEYAGYEPLIPDPGRSVDREPRPVFGGRPEVGGATKTVTVSGPDDAGWHVTFVTGSGDCQPAASTTALTRSW